MMFLKCHTYLSRQVGHATTFYVGEDSFAIFFVNYYYRK